MFAKVLIANRGEIACRIVRTLRRLGISSVAVYSEADKDSLHVSEADEAVLIGPAPVAASYLNQEAILQAAKRTGAEAIHPGYGLLSESPVFAEACEAAGLAFVGPTPDQIRAFALKHEARRLAEEAQVPLLPGTGVISELGEAIRLAKKIGYPVILKSSGGGGGIGMAVCQGEEELAGHYETVKRLSQANFSSDELFLEKFVTEARHVEVQALGDGLGSVWVMGERDCSLQRRNQKVIEETPAPGLSEDVRNALASAATQLLQSVSYRSAGTVEFLYDAKEEAFYFLEVNTRLQVEHGVTEFVMGVDLVEMMLRVSARLPIDSVSGPSGHSMQARVYAENPDKDFQPSTGLLTHVAFPDDARVDTWISRGLEVTPYYDPLLAKIMVHGKDREEAAELLAKALRETRIDGLTSNRAYLGAVVDSPEFRQGLVSTAFLNRFQPESRSIEVVHAGTLTTIHDVPGRVGYWEVGIPPSGPMDERSFRLVNRLVGNPEEAAGLEMAMSGPSLRFGVETVVALGGADMQATVDGDPVPRWHAVSIPAGGVLRLDTVEGPGARAYLAVRGGIDVPLYLGSRSTFALGAFGGHGGRPLRSGDVLPLDQCEPEQTPWEEVPPKTVPELMFDWKIRVIEGPHSAPDFFLPEYLETFLETEWKVHFNSARTGIRLIGPKPGWAREDGGEAGLHPSNIHDNPYAIGAIDFTGDLPVILGPDGPSLGGFVCPFTVAQSDLWMLGQVKAGDRIRFVRVGEKGSPVLLRQTGKDRPDLVYRRSGERNLLVEVGPPKLDLELRLKVHQLYRRLKELDWPGLIDLTPGVRSLQLHVDGQHSVEDWVRRVQEVESDLPSLEDDAVPARVVHLPLAWDDPSTREAIAKYDATVRKDAPWYPSNIEFIRRINGLASIDEVYDIVFAARYVVLGLGDVYLGAPVATPLDPRHRLVTTKYNPARTWTPENAVGIGGAYLCIYGMEGPGGYQFVGRTVPVWNRYRVTPHFEEGKPWLLRFFDQIQFYPVSTDALQDIRHDFVRGRYDIKVEETNFKLSAYHRFLEDHAASIAAFRQTQRQAFAEERERWGASELEMSEEASLEAEVETEAVGTPIESPIAGSVWKVCVEEGETVEEGQVVAVLESMKMEMKVEASCGGVVSKLAVRSGATVEPGQAIAYLEN